MNQYRPCTEPVEPLEALIIQSAHPVSRSEQLHARPPAPIYGLGIVADHARKVVAEEDGRAGLIHD